MKVEENLAGTTKRISENDGDKKRWWRDCVSSEYDPNIFYTYIKCHHENHYYMQLLQNNKKITTVVGNGKGISSLLGLEQTEEELI